MSVRGNAYVVGPWTDVGGEERVVWSEHYNRIGEALLDVGFNAFLPHELLAGLPREELVRKLRMFLRSSKLVVADLSIASPDAEAILRRVRRGRSRGVIVLRNVRGDTIDPEMLTGVHVLHRIDYCTMDACVGRLRDHLLEQEYHV